MNIIYDRNDWTVFIHEDINTLNNQQAKRVAELIAKNLVVVFKEQILTPEQEVAFCSKIGTVKTYGEKQKDISVGNHILRVTGQKNEKGEPGLFGHVSDLDWHCNQPSEPNRNPLIWLYSLTGSKGSVTSWINMIRAYDDLPKHLKEEIKDIKIRCGWINGKFGYNDKHFTNHVNTEIEHNIVQTNHGGKTGLFFPFLQTFGFVDRLDFKSLSEKLIKHVTQEQYIYHHYWDDGDVVISDQWLSLHKRWRFEDMDKRILHRISFDYSNVYS